MLTQSRLQELLFYDPVEGNFRWKRNNALAGSANGRSGQYLRIRVDGAPYQAHRLAWLYRYGEFPAGQLDHIDRNGRNNAIRNLRLSEPYQNAQNKSGDFLGIQFRGGKWAAKIQHQKVQIYLGRFDSEETAKAAYLAKKAELHEFWEG